MKTFTAILFLSLAPVLPGYAQVASDSLTQRDSVSLRAKHFIDENGNGIDDRLEKKGKRDRHSRDRFIDNDGDGICDGRESGLGFRGGGTSGSGRGRPWRGGRK